MKWLLGLCLLVPVPVWAQGQPAVVVTVATCRLTVTSVPPDSLLGWRVQFRRGTGTAIGNRDSTPPYTQTSGALSAGPYDVWGEWINTTTGATRRSAVTRAVCAGTTSVDGTPWIVAPPPVLPILSMTLPNTGTANSTLPMVITLIQGGDPVAMTVTRGTTVLSVWPSSAGWLRDANQFTLTVHTGPAGVAMFHVSAAYAGGAVASASIAVNITAIIAQAIEWTPSPDPSTDGYVIQLTHATGTTILLPSAPIYLTADGWYHRDAPELSTLPSGVYVLVMRSVALGVEGPNSIPLEVIIP